MDEDTPICQGTSTTSPEQNEDLAPSTPQADQLCYANLDIAPRTPQELPPSTPEAGSVQKMNIKEGDETSPSRQVPRALPAMQALPTPCRGGRRRTPTHYTPLNEDLARSSPEVGQAESIQNTISKEGQEPSSAKQQSHSLPPALPTPCRGGLHRAPPLHYMAVNEAETVSKTSSREGEELSPARLQLSPLSSARIDSSEDCDISTSGHPARQPRIMPGKLRFYATVAAVLAPLVVLLAAIFIFFDPGHHAFHDDLTARPVSANLQGLVMPGAQQTERSGFVPGGRGSAPVGPVPSKQPVKANNEKVFDFRPTFYDQGTRRKSLVKAPTKLGGGLPGPFVSGHESWLRQGRPLTSPKSYPAVVAAAEAAGVAALHAESSQGTSSTARRGVPAAATSRGFPMAA